MELLKQGNGNLPRTEEEKLKMIEEATIHYGNFLTAMGFNWSEDPHFADTPKRVAKSWVRDLIAGTNTALSDISSFPNAEGYTGLICQTKIPVTSLCIHHNLSFTGVAHVAYIAGKEPTDMIIGLSKLNRIVDWYSRRPNVQESLTKQISDTINELCVGNRGVAVVIESQHNCVKCRGVRNDSVMKTSEMSGYFFDNPATRQEFFSLIDQSRY